MTLLVLFAGGIAALIAGANLLVRGASSLAAALGIPPLVIGLTVVAFGTSAPELAVSVQSAWSGQTDIALGNAVGSNIVNVLFILGLSALIVPLAVSQQVVRQEVPVMIAACVLLFLLALGGAITRGEGALLLALLIAYTVYLVLQARRQQSHASDYSREFGRSAARRGRQWLLQLAYVASGLTLLVLGSGWLVDGAVQIAMWLGLSELIIGLTIVAAGTSLPEAAASLIAGLKGERDIAVGNVVGSCIFNILAVLGLSALVSSDGLEVAPALVHFDIPVMIAASVACLPVFFTDYRIARWEGALLFAYYMFYTAYLILSATHHAALPAFNAAMLFVALPLTAVTLLVILVRRTRQPPT